MILRSSRYILLVHRTHRVAAIQVSVTVVVLSCCVLRCLPFSKISVACFGYSTWGPASAYGCFCLHLAKLTEHCLAPLWFWIKKKSMTAKGLCSPQISLPLGNTVVNFLPFCMMCRGLPCWTVNGGSSSGRVWLECGQVYS